MNKYKDIALKAIHKLYREDPWVRELYQAAGLEITEVSDLLDEVYSNSYFDTATLKAIERYEKELNIEPTGEVDGRRSTIEAKWKSGGTATLEKLQSIVSSYKNGVIKLSFEGGRIHVAFNSPIGRPNDLDQIKAMLEEVKPAHLAIYYTFSYLTWGIHHEHPRTWGDLKKMNWGEVLQLGGV